MPYRLKEPFDFSFLGAYGRVFKVYDDVDSGNIWLRPRKGRRAVFSEICRRADGVSNGFAGSGGQKSLKVAAPLYRTLRHENLVELIESGPLGGGWGLLFRWTDGVAHGPHVPGAACALWRCRRRSACAR